jgi:hypothetical protein
MNQMTPHAALLSGARSARRSRPDPRRWHRREALYSRLAARSEEACASLSAFAGEDPALDAKVDRLVDQSYAAMMLLVATPAPTVADVRTKVELILASLGDNFHVGPWPHILADLKRLT